MINIAHLYYDLLNLYGESGNIKILKKSFEELGLKVNIHFLTIDDEVKFDKYDLIYIGSGTENNQEIVLKHLMKYKDEIKKQVENNKFFLITGNAINLFGKCIEKENKKIKALNTFDFYSKEEVFRMVDECIFKCSFIKKPILGFQNRSTIIKENIYPMFEVIKGIGYYPNSTEEGIKYKNFYGTYLIGPLLIRNPEFLNYIIKSILEEKNINFKKLKLSLENKAYDEYINNYYKNII